MRPLWEAALEAQAQRVIASRPADLPVCHSALVVPPCKNCGGRIRACTTNGTGTGYCGANSECRKLAKAVAMERYRVRHPRIVKPVPAEQFCGHCGKRLGEHGRRTRSGYCRTGACRYRRILELKAHRPAAKVGALPQNGKVG